MTPCKSWPVWWLLEFWQKPVLGGFHPHNTGDFLSSSFTSLHSSDFIYIFLPSWYIFPYNCHQTIYRKCMCFCRVKNKYLGFWINNGMEEFYCCSRFSCTQMGESDGREWKRWSWRSQFAKYSDGIHRPLQVRAEQTAVFNNRIQHKVTFGPSC